MEEVWVSIGGSQGMPVALVLDASMAGPGDAKKARESVLRCALRLLEALPDKALASVWFLGSRTAQAGQGFQAAAGRLMQENEGRARVLGPVFSRLEEEAPGRVLVLAAGPIVDVADWRSSPPWERTSFVRCGTAAVTAGLGTELSADSLDCLRTALDNPLVEVRLGAEGAMPVGWENDGYRYVDFMLRGTNLGDFATRAGFMIPPGVTVQAVERYADGSERTLDLEPCGPAPAATQEPVLCEGDAALVSSCLASQGYECPVCRQRHDASKLSCEKGGSLLPRRVLAILEAAPREGYFLIRMAGGAWRYRYHPRPVLRVGDDVVAVRGPSGMPELHVFDRARRRWQGNGLRLGQFHRLADSGYVVIP